MRLSRLLNARAVALCSALVGLIIVCADTPTAHAYPQFQLSTGNTRCSLCHFNPAGGGLVRDYGRDEASGSLSTFEGSGGLLHGLWSPPDWLALGGDFRGAGIYKKTSDDPRLLGFPMQGDLYARVAVGAFSINGTAGLRGAAREPRPSTVDRLGSREHYLMWAPDDDVGLYVRAGRFFAPYGVRTQDHSAYVRRYLGQHTLEETYNLSVGKVDDQWEIHGTVYVPPSLLGFAALGDPAMGAAVYYERRAREDTLAWAAQSKVEFGEHSSRAWLGGVGKLWLENARLLVLSELDIGMQRFDDSVTGADPRMQLVAHLGLTYLAHRGLSVGTALERYDPDVTLKGTARNSANLSVQWMVYPHLEAMLVGKLEAQGGLADASPLGMFMLHYYL